MTNTLPKFDNPPVVETVMSVQFAPLADFSPPYAGWYWKHCLGDQWTRVDLASPLPDQSERFEDEARWRRPGIRVELSPAPEPVRVQIVQDDDERMIQIQKTRFIYNWRKRGSTYPSYATLRPEFDGQLAKFSAFIEQARLGALEPNQWEMTYVNHIEKGVLWDRPDDWPNVLPGFYTVGPSVSGRRFESFGGEWHMVIEPNRGRLHVAVRHGKIGEPGGAEVLVLQLTARGPLGQEKARDLDSGLRLGHETIVRSFAAMTSDVAHRHWRRTT
ncbi:MAG: TIGR04255 family protein [Phycisphaerales bacterium]|nr:MAG: TIGR04255 family protein [Phycisphaerales bacterium]